MPNITSDISNSSVIRDSRQQEQVLSVEEGRTLDLLLVESRKQTALLLAICASAGVQVKSSDIFTEVI